MAEEEEILRARCVKTEAELLTCRSLDIYNDMCMGTSLHVVRNILGCIPHVQEDHP